MLFRSVTELASEVGLHVSTVHNILAVLHGRGYLLNEGGRYRCGPALVRLANRANPLADIARLAQPLLDGITKRTGESAVVGVLSGAGVALMATTSSADGLSCPAPGQVFVPAVMMATGRLLVAFGDQDQWAEQLAAYRLKTHSVSDPAATDRREWARTLGAIRESGVCVLWRGQDSGSVAVAVRDARGVVVAALGANSIGRATDAGYWDELTANVEEAGRQLSAELGYAAARSAQLQAKNGGERSE